MTPQPHEVRVLCSCEDIECCRTERYIADIRILMAELEANEKQPIHKGDEPC